MIVPLAALATVAARPRRALLLGTRDIHRKRAALEFFGVQQLNSVLRFGGKVMRTVSFLG